MSDPRTPVAPEHVYRLLNHGPTVLVTSAHAGRRNVMAASWNMALDFTPPKVAVVIDKSTRTRELVEASGRFGLAVPSRAIAPLVLAIGRMSARELPDGMDKFTHLSIETLPGAQDALPHPVGCLAWLDCRVLSEPAIEARYDLFLGEVEAAWADPRVFSNGRWRYGPDTPAELQTLHYVAGGTFLTV
ncbi:MAG: flavin reductase family protein, partial [Burkholderiales bacterium]|nr:flavin reductase family protein [Burkholderiales bacterium]